MIVKVRVYSEDRDFIMDSRKGKEKQQDTIKRLLKRKEKKE